MNLRTVVYAAALASLPCTAQAATIVDTGPGPTSGNGPTLARSQFIAGEFTTGAVTIQQVEGWIDSAARESINVRLYTDGGDVPGSALFSSSFITSVGRGWQGVSGLGWLVTAGTYWIAFESNGNGFSQMPTVRGIPASPLVNEARTTAFGGAYLADDSLNVGVRISGAVAAVPEPATWALMIAGFAFVGAALRDRKRRVLAAA